MKTIAGFGAALAIIVGLAACGGLDTADVEGIFEDQVGTLLEEGAFELTVESVSCPDDISSDPGTTFECSAELSDGDTLTATGKVGKTEGDQANITFDPSTLEFASQAKGGGN